MGLMDGLKNLASNTAGTIANLAGAASEKLSPRKEHTGVSLSKGEKISLEKTAGKALSKVTMGLGWDPAVKGRSIDLDASCVLFDDQGREVDTVWFRHLKSNDGSVRHTGDNLTGEGDGDDEQINVDLSRVPASVKSLIFTVNSFQGQKFTAVANAYCRLLDDSRKEIAYYDLSGGQNSTAIIMAKVYRHNGEWKMGAIGEEANGQTVKDLVSAIRPFI